MQFLTDDDELSITLALDSEHQDLDLSTGLGDLCLDVAARELGLCWAAESAPSGAKWDHLAAGTVRAKGHDTIGRRTGGMLGSAGSAPRDVTARSATWTFPQPEGRRKKEHGFHNGQARNRQPARPLVGWTARAQAECRALVERAELSIDNEARVI